MNLEQINRRLAEIEGLINTESDTAKLAEYSKEIRSLLEQRGRLMGEATGAARAEARSAFNDASRVQTMVPQASEEPLTKREKINLLTGLVARKKSPDDVQKRALGVALTTTATTYVAASAIADGVNNAGILIPTQLILDLLKEEGKLSPILADIAFLTVKGLTVFPYRASRTAANAKAEGSGTGKNQFELTRLQLIQGWLQINIDVTDEVVALTDIDLGAYIVENIANDLSEDWAYDLIYGAGSDNHVKGLVSGALTTGISAYTTGTALDAIVKGIKLCKGKFRRGAKIYLAQDVYDEVAFAVDENGNFKYPAINNTVGISAIGAIQVSVDENLAVGDFVIGNVGKFYKANLLRGLNIESERDVNKHITTFNASQFVAAAPFPGAFVHGSKAS